MVVMLSKEKTESTLNRCRITRLYILIIIIIIFGEKLTTIFINQIHHC